MFFARSLVLAPKDNVNSTFFETSSNKPFNKKFNIFVKAIMGDEITVPVLAYFT